MRIDREGAVKLTFEISKTEAHKVIGIPTETELDLEVTSFETPVAGHVD